MNLSISKDAKARIKVIGISGKLGFISLLITGFIIVYFLSEEIPAPILGAILVVLCLLAFTPYFLLKNGYEKWYLSKINPLLVTKANKKGVSVSYEKATFSNEDINACDILQNVDLVEGEFLVTIKTSNKTAALSRINCYNYIHHKISNKDIKEGRRLPVFEGIFISIHLNNMNSPNNIILVSQNIPRSDSSFSTLRLQKELYKDGGKVNIKGHGFYQYGVEAGSNSIKRIEGIINTQKMLEISEYLIVGLSNNGLYIIYPGTEYFKIPTDKSIIEESINRDYHFLGSLVNALSHLNQA